MFFKLCFLKEVYLHRSDNLFVVVDRKAYFYRISINKICRRNFLRIFFSNSVKIRRQTLLFSSKNRIFGRPNIRFSVYPYLFGWEFLIDFLQLIFWASWFPYRPLDIAKLAALAPIFFIAPNILCHFFSKQVQ